MKKTKTLKSKQTKLYFCGVLTIIFILSVVGFKSYSFVMQKYREEKIMQQIQQYVTELNELLQTQDNYKVLNKKIFNSKWNIITDTDTIKKISNYQCTVSDKYHENGTPVLYCEKLLFGRDFTPDYAYTDYMIFPNIYGGEIFVLIGKKVCKADDTNHKTCAFIRFRGLPKETCIKIATYNKWYDKVDLIRVNTLYNFFYSIFSKNFSVNYDVKPWKKNSSFSEAEELCFQPNNWIDFLIYKD